MKSTQYRIKTFVTSSKTKKENSKCEFDENNDNTILTVYIIQKKFLK